jgi:hypothetical protein
MADTDRQKKFYTNQRVQAEEAADEGDVRARGVVDKINSKLGKGPREYTDADAVNKEALASVAPDAGEGLLAAKGLGMLGRFGKGLVAKGLEKKAASTAKKAASKGYESMEETAMKKAPSKVARSTTDRRATPRDNDRRIAEMDKQRAGDTTAGRGKDPELSSGRKALGTSPKGQVKETASRTMTKAKSVTKTGEKAPDRVNKPLEGKSAKTSKSGEGYKDPREASTPKPKAARKPRAKKPPAGKPKPAEKAPEPPAKKYTRKEGSPEGARPLSGKIKLSDKKGSSRIKGLQPKAAEEKPPEPKWKTSPSARKAVKGSDKRNATGDYAGSKTRIAKRPVMSQRTMAARDRMKKELAARKAKKK